MKPDSPPKKRRRWWRWAWRFVVIVLVLAAALGWWAWKERVLLVNTLLLRLGGDVRVQLTALDWENGALHAREVRATHVPAAKRLAEVERIEWRPGLRQLRTRNLGVVKIFGGALDLPLALLQSGSPPQDDATAVSSPWRLEVLDLAETKVVLHDENHKPVLNATVRGQVKGGTTEGAFEAAGVEVEDVVYRGSEVLKVLRVKAVKSGEKIEVQEGVLNGGRVDLAWLNGFNLPLRGGVEIDWTGSGMTFSAAGLHTGGTHEVRLKNLRLQTMADAGAMKADAVDLKVSHDSSGLWHVREGRVLSPVIDWTRDLEEVLLPKEKASSKSAWQVRVDALEVKDGRVMLAKTGLCPVAGEFGWSTRLQALEISPEGVRSAAKQRLEVADVSLRWSGADPGVRLAPFASMKSAALEVVPDKLREQWQVESLLIDSPRLELKPENGPWFEKMAGEPAKPVSGNTEPKPWQRMQFGQLTVKNGAMDVAMKLAERVEATTRFEVSTKEARQHLRVVDVHVRVPKRANLPVLSLENVEAVAALPEMWGRRRLESLKLAGGQIEVGDALMTLFSGDAAVVEKKAEAAAARWTAGRIDVEKLGVTLMSIAPGLPPVRFDVTFGADETPLDLDGLAENAEPQRIVLTRLRVPSPHEPLRTVAEMDVIHVNYTLDGLLHRRIDRVEIISPLLYVGEDLFWYVENYRKIMKGEAPPPDARFGPPAPPDPVAPGWRVDTLAVSDGRLLLAPKGVPLRGFSKPFPFSFTTKLESGQLDAVFDIPTDDYALPEHKLEFRGMKGHVRFNLPMKDRNNNLTETFTMEQLRWKELHMEKAHLSVTYDVRGIYGSFGGEAYGGYVNGAFNIYLDEVFTWDGWLSGVDVSLGPVTRALFPQYLLLEGAAEGKVIATGNMNELYQADAEFKNRSRGKFSIQALNDMIAELPPAMKGDITDQFTRIGLETLRDFEYGSIDGKARFYGREGRGHLRFTGPRGSRKIDINVYDHRWKEEPRRTAGSNDG
ncbi:MAG: hypothetical protein JNM65_05825 [Verrucomicrobiaceae bacterium]|nr:hypothetical protein [Verrucomicrobiaceae bacterium]